MRLLMIEDNKRLGEYVSTACSARGFAVDHVGSAADGLAAIGATNYDVVILDLGLPDGDGLSWLQAIRRNNDQTPVLILSARDGVQTVVEGLNLGADDYLSKPVVKSNLVETMEKWIAALGSPAQGGDIDRQAGGSEHAAATGDAEAS